MVFSHLNKTIEYPESREIDPEDIDHDAAIYEIEIYGKSHLVALGKPKYTFSTKYDVVYFPIYLVRKNKIRGKVGVYEIERTRILSIMDKEKDVKIERLGDPLWFSVTTEEYIVKTDAVYIPPVEEEDLEEKEIEPVVEEIKNKPVEEEEPESEEPESESEEEDDVLSLQKNKKSKESEKESKSEKEEKEEKRVTKDTIFTKDATPPAQKTWPEESEEESKKYHQEYDKTKSTNDNWVQTFFKNKNYGILKNEGGGDCLFATVRDAYEEIGYHTTVLKLRTLISQEIDLKQFEERMKLYREIRYGVENTEQEMDDISKKNQSLKKQTGGADKEMLKEMVAGAKELKKKYQTTKEKHEVDKELLREFEFMKDIKSIDDLKMYVKTSSFWADTWAISTLERLLDVKIIILEDTTDKDAVMLCGQLNDEVDTFSPKYYLIVNYTMNGNHYELITYQKKRLFTFQEIPYDIKILIVNKCMERAAGPYAIIPAFRQFQQDLGVEPEVSEQVATPLEEGICEDTILFIFHEKSDSSKKPGQGIQEKMVATRLSEFSELMKKPVIPWRQQLDDTWDTAPFEVDHLRWTSISHYLLALPFKTVEPEIYKDFSLSGSKKEIAEKLEVAKEALEFKKGKKGVFYEKKKNAEEPTKSEMDDFRKEALMAKFSQNLDLKKMLHATGKACLHKFKRGKESEADILLMQVRRDLGEKE